nr:MAG: anhydro-N-acetylmuramic acid kinase [Hyphomicrobiales bacterium]
MTDSKKGAVVKAIGLMSGTSLDGIDAALLETDGEGVVFPGSALTVPYDTDLRTLLRAAMEEAARAPLGGESSNRMRDAEQRLTAAHAGAVERLLGDSGLDKGEIAYVGFHGQTILHRPSERSSWQLGDGAMLAHEIGIPVINDFRSADIASGGQGAPFAALYHLALAKSAGALLPMVVLNIGGVANVTYIGSDDVLIAFDTGPGNAAIDDWMMKQLGEPMDRNGALAQKGIVQQETVMQMLSHPYFSLPPPKSLDRFDFSREFVSEMSPEDGAATLTAFTVLSIVRGTEHFPMKGRGWLVSGGGRHNLAMMESLRGVLRAPVLPVEKAGWRGDFLEAEAFAYLAVRSAKGLPLSLPSTTGVPEPMTGGRLHRPF